MAKTMKLIPALLTLASLAACTVPPDSMSAVTTPGQAAPVMMSGGVTRNTTPYDAVLACYGHKISRKGLSIAVGDIKDYTGKSVESEGMLVTQGGALMAYSALGKMAPGVKIKERFDTRIADAELSYMNQRQLGDGATHSVPDKDTGVSSDVPWVPYFGGTILQSGYYIVGGITEVNFNINSGGAEFQIDQVGPRSRTYVMNVALDLRIVDTQTLEVVKTVSVQKQIVGYEVGVDMFKFFDDYLFDINAGTKNQEPLQLGIRMAIEDAVLQLVASVAKTEPDSCLTAQTDSAAASAATTTKSAGGAQASSGTAG